MSTTKKRPNFFETEEGLQTREALVGMVTNTAYNTDSSYSADAIKYPDGKIPFVDKHMKYLSEHQNVNLDHYLSNLRLMTRFK